FRSMSRKRSGSASRRARAADRLMAFGPSPCAFLGLTPDRRHIHFGRGIDLDADKCRYGGDGCSWLGEDVLVVENQWRQFEVRDHGLPGSLLHFDEPLCALDCDRSVGRFVPIIAFLLVAPDAR